MQPTYPDTYTLVDKPAFIRNVRLCNTVSSLPEFTPKPQNPADELLRFVSREDFAMPGNKTFLQKLIRPDFFSVLPPEFRSKDLVNPDVTGLFAETCGDLHSVITNTDMTWLEVTETCIRVSTVSWELLKKHLSESFFINEASETIFFKYVKPRYCGLIEFFSLVYQSSLFEPQHDAPRSDYWKAEAKRYEKFHDIYRGFIEYWRSGPEEMDVLWFLRKTNEQQQRISGKLYDHDENFFSSGDHLVTAFLGHRYYFEFALHRIFHLSA